MERGVKAITQNDLLEALRKYGKATARRPAGQGWYTLHELAAMEDPPITIPALKYRIQQAQKQGIRFEMAGGTQIDEEGKARKAVYYRLKNGKP